jgi:hypothetical protein
MEQAVQGCEAPPHLVFKAWLSEQLSYGLNVANMGKIARQAESYLLQRNKLGGLISKNLESAITKPTPQKSTEAIENMSTISNSLFCKLSDSLATYCASEFGSTHALKVVFRVQELSTYRDHLPEAVTPKQRIEFLLDFLIDKTQDGKNVLVTFLAVMADRQKGDDCATILLGLAHEVELELALQSVKSSNLAEISNP